VVGLGKEPHRLKELDLLPETPPSPFTRTRMFPWCGKTWKANSNSPPCRMWTRRWPRSRSNSKSAAGISLDDALGSLGGGYGVIFTLDDSKEVTLPIGTNSLDIPSPALAIFFKVKNDAIYNALTKSRRACPWSPK